MQHTCYKTQLHSDYPPNCFSGFSSYLQMVTTSEMWIESFFAMMLEKCLLSTGSSPLHEFEHRPSKSFSTCRLSRTRRQRPHLTTPVADVSASHPSTTPRRHHRSPTRGLNPVSFILSSCSSRCLLQACRSLRAGLLCDSDQQPPSAAIMNIPLISCSTMTEQDHLRSAFQRTLAHVAPYRYFDTVDCLQHP